MSSNFTAPIVTYGDNGPNPSRSAVSKHKITDGSARRDLVLLLYYSLILWTSFGGEQHRVGTSRSQALLKIHGYGRDSCLDIVAGVSISNPRRFVGSRL